MYEYATFEYPHELVKHLNRNDIKKDNIISITVDSLGVYHLIFKI